MATQDAFNLPEFMFCHFCRVDFGGDLFSQWPVGIRFEIGIDRVARAVELYNFATAQSEECVLVSQDWLGNEREVSEPSTPLFETPGIFPLTPVNFKTMDVFPYDESGYRLTWAAFSPVSFDATRLFQGIAHREQPGNPRINSGVYLIEPARGLIIHMYDDRGLDVIATRLDDLRPMFEKFRPWILDYARQRIDLRFNWKPPGSSEDR